MPSPNSQVTPASRARTDTVSGPEDAVASGIEALPRSQNHDGRPVSPVPGLMPMTSVGHGCLELAWSASAISGVVGGSKLSDGLGTHTMPSELPLES